MKLGVGGLALVLAEEVMVVGDGGGGEEGVGGEVVEQLFFGEGVCFQDRAVAGGEGGWCGAVQEQVMRGHRHLPALDGTRVRRHLRLLDGGDCWGEKKANLVSSEVVRERGVGENICCRCGSVQTPSCVRWDWVELTRW